MKPTLLARSLALAGTLALANLCAVHAANAATPERAHAAARHVVLVSVDGLHETDLEAYIASHPGSTLARLVNEGTSYANATTPFPSDSFPGLTAIVTGGNPRTTGIYYDDSWNRALLPAGTTACAGKAPGTEVTYFEQLDRNPDALDAGIGVGDLSTPAAITQNIYKLPKQARDGIDPAQLPVDPATCTVVYPHAYLRANTVFEVARAHGLHTAWSDKHMAYELVNGPSGSGVDDLFAPEINSLVPDGSGNDWTKDNLDTQFYDNLKVQAVINWARGGDHAGTPDPAGAPAIYGMNFQSVSTAQKLNFSHFAGDGGVKGLGGYAAGGTQAGPVLAGALDFVDAELAKIVAAVDPRDTLVVVTAKHGQSPLDRSQLRLVDDGEVMDALNAAWAAAHPAATQNLVLFGINDDGMLLWLSDRSREATEFARDFLWSYSPLEVGGSDAGGNLVDYSGTLRHSGLRQVLAGREAADFIGVPVGDARVPDVIGIAQVGTVYSSPTKIKKIAEHGGDARQDRHVPIIAWGAGARSVRIHDEVETTQIAPTVLEALGLPASELKAVRAERTEPLPALR